VIRPATLIDIPRMVELGQIMHAESRHRDLSFDAPKFARVIESLIDYPDGLAIVAVKGGQVIGGFLGIAEAHFFSEEKFSFDLATFIDPAQRGGFVAAALLKAYVKWAQARGIAEINAGVASGINHEVSVRLYERIGFEHTGVTLRYQGRTR
jgi:GNAT superfamily N-acetyltransferase